MEDKDGKLRLGLVATHLLAGNLDVLLELADGILEGGTGVVDLIDNEDALADEVLHVAEGGQVEPLGAGDLGAGGLDVRVLAELLIEGQTDGLDGDVGRAGLLEERAQDARRDVAAAANGNHQLGLEVVEEAFRRLLAQVVHLGRLETARVSILSLAGVTCALLGEGVDGKGDGVCVETPRLVSCACATITQDPMSRLYYIDFAPPRNLGRKNGEIGCVY